jgi:hypothetical protein
MASYFAYRQVSIYRRQADIMDKQADHQGRQTTLLKLQSEISRRQTDIAEKQMEIAQQQLVITEYQEQERRKGRLLAELMVRIEHRKVGDRVRDFLQIENKGPADARNITIVVKGELDGHILDLPKELPLITAGMTRDYPILLCVGMSNEFILDIGWSDDSGEPRHKRIPMRV